MMIILDVETLALKPNSPIAETRTKMVGPTIPSAALIEMAVSIRPDRNMKVAAMNSIVADRYLKRAIPVTI